MDGKVIATQHISADCWDLPFCFLNGQIFVCYECTGRDFPNQIDVLLSFLNVKPSGPHLKYKKITDY